MIEQKKTGAEKQEKDMKKEYEALRPKFALPTFEELDKEFFLGNLEQNTFVLRPVLFKIDERLEYVIKILEDLLQPESHLVDMHEAESLSEDDKKAAFELLKRISLYQTDFVIADFDYSDELAASMIIKVHKEWKVFKADFLRILGKIKESWRAEIKSDQEFGYFG